MTSGSTVLLNELICYLKSQGPKICAINYGALTFTIQEGKLSDVEIREQHKRGKEINASLFNSLLD